MQLLKTVAHDYRVKMAAQKMISFIPGRMGFKVNQFMTNLSRRGESDHIDIKSRFLKGIDNIKKIKKCTPKEFTLSEKTVLEIGTGWHGEDLLIFFCLGARKIITIDHYQHLTFKSVMNSAKALNDADVVKAFHSVYPSSVLIEKIAHLEQILGQANSLSDILEALSVSYIIMSSGEYKNFEIEDSLDLVYSESVLQRIPERHLQDLFEAIRTHLNQDAISFHRTDQKDINSQDHADEKLWPLHYLKYSELMWQAMQCRFNYQNRLRESDFISLLAGYTPPMCIESYCRDGDIKRLESIKLATKFQGKSMEDIAVRSSIFICKYNRGETTGMEDEVIRNVNRSQYARHLSAR